MQDIDIDAPHPVHDEEVVSAFVSNSFSSAAPPSPAKKKRRHIPRSFRKTHEEVYGELPRDELVEALVEAQYENKRLRGGLTLALERLKEERVRTDTAYAFSEDLVERIRKLHTQRADLKAQISDGREAIERWRIEYEHLRTRAQQGESRLSDIQSQLLDSEQRAKEARRDARREEMERVRREAIDEGRRQGMTDGYQQAVREVVRRRERPRLEEYEEPEVPEEEEDEEEPEAEEEEEDEGEPRYYGGRTDTEGSSFYARPPASAGPPPIVAIPTHSNSPPRPVTPAVERWVMSPTPTASPSVSHHPPFHTPPDNLIPLAGAAGDIVLAPPHEFAGSMRASSPNHVANLHLPSTNDKGKGRAYAASDSTTISNLPITQDATHQSTPVGINVEAASSSHAMSHRSSRSRQSNHVPPASQFQLSRTDEWDQSAQPTYPASLAQHIQPYSTNPDPSRPYYEPIPPDPPSPQQPEWKNPDITPFDPGLTPSIRRFERLPTGSRSRVNSLAGRDGHSVKSGRSVRSRLSVVNPDPPSPRPNQYVFPSQGPSRPQSQYRAPSPRPASQYMTNGRAPSPSQFSRHSRAASQTTQPGLAGIGAGRTNTDNSVSQGQGHTLHRARSSLSQRTNGRYDHFEGKPEDDPAMWGQRV
ncbi:hypothetical protein CPB85DRAFT_924250 [Mucidula mucida]|nr:hypothetical protein CPB85DRAFT_924250 [Mucidula mucida]